MTSDVRSEQRIKPQFAAERFIEHFDSGVDQQNRQMRIGYYIFYQTVAAVRLRICETIKEAIARRILDHMIEVAFFFVAKTFTVADEKLKVACVWFIDMWIIDVIDDSVIEREPDTATCMISRAVAFFGARSTTWLDCWRAKRHLTLRRI